MVATRFAFPAPGFLPFVFASGSVALACFCLLLHVFELLLQVAHRLQLAVPLRVIQPAALLEEITFQPSSKPLVHIGKEVIDFAAVGAVHLWR